MSEQSQYELKHELKTRTSELNFEEHRFFIDEIQLHPQINSNLLPEEKANDILSQMTFEEKILMIAGDGWLSINRIPRLGLCKIWCSDASSGIRTFGRSTAFPALIGMTASWNKILIKKVAMAIGEECRAKGISILLAPGVNLYRLPTNGRNFEYMGEDPFLTGEMVAEYIQGAQSRGVITTVKHFACNNTDKDRHRVDVKISERALHELYLPAFRKAVFKGKTKGVMTAYNLVNGIHCSENKYLISEILRKKWGFTGFVISDWLSVYSSEGPMKAGLDLEMPISKYYNAKKLKEMIIAGQITEDEINKKVLRLLYTFFEAGVYERPIKDVSAVEFGPEHDKIALDIARESIVLLKNEKSLLPLDPNKNPKIVIMGRNAKNTPTSGAGSAWVKAFQNTSIMDAFIDIIPAKNLTFIPIPDDLKISPLDQNVFNGWLDYYRDTIRSAEYVIFAGGYDSYHDSEHFDRSWLLIENQSEILNAIADLNDKCIAIMNAGGGFETESWIHKIPAVIHSFYLGQYPGIPIVEIIFGKISPSGKLPFSMAKKWNDFSSISHYYPYPEYTTTSWSLIEADDNEKNRFEGIPMEYKEDIMVGYRHFENSKIVPQFPFGHGLSYTTFEYSALNVESDDFSGNREIIISLKVKNTGLRIGSETVQLYISENEPSVVRPPKELKRFEKITLKPNESREISFSISKELLEFYDEIIHDWKANDGDFTLYIGASSSDIRLTYQINYRS